MPQDPRPSATRVAVRVAKKWKNLPKGWTEESVKKFWDTLTSRAPKHPVTRCIKEMDGKVSNPGAFCGGLADQEIPGWREEAAKKRKEKKACGDGPCQCGGECGCQKGGSPLSMQPDYGTSEAALPRAASIAERFAAGSDFPQESDVIARMRRLRKGDRIKFDKGMGHIFGGTEYEKMEEGRNGRWLMTAGRTGNLPYGWEENPSWLQSPEEVAERDTKYALSVYQTR